jgi:hypothetical protein
LEFGMEEEWRDDEVNASENLKPMFRYWTMTRQQAGGASLLRIRRDWTITNTMILATIGLVIAIGTPARLHAQDDKGWLGKRVVAK